MSKVLIQLKKGILLDIYGNQTLEAVRPQVVKNTTFVQNRIAKGEIELLGVLKDDATDEAFAKIKDVAKFLKSNGIKKEAEGNAKSDAKDEEAKDEEVKDEAIKVLESK